MVAALLYVVGLVATLVTIVVVGFNAPTLIQTVNAGLAAPNADYVAVAVAAANGLAWALTPFVGGLLLMGFGRVLVLLGSIDRALRGNP
jgi:hypothetical protein